MRDVEVRARVEKVKAVLQKPQPTEADTREALAAVVDLLGELVLNTSMIAMR